MKYVVDNIKNYSDGWIAGYTVNKISLQKNNDIEVNISTLQPGFTAKKHCHPKSKMIIIITKGKIKMAFEDKEFIMSKNDFVMLDKGVFEEVKEVYKPTTMICIRTPSVADNKLDA